VNLVGRRVSRDCRAELRLCLWRSSHPAAPFRGAIPRGFVSVGQPQDHPQPSACSAAAAHALDAFSAHLLLRRRRRSCVANKQTVAWRLTRPAARSVHSPAVTLSVCALRLPRRRAAGRDRRSSQTGENTPRIGFVLQISRNGASRPPAHCPLAVNRSRISATARSVWVDTETQQRAFGIPQGAVPFCPPNKSLKPTALRQAQDALPRRVPSILALAPRLWGEYTCR